MKLLNTHKNQINNLLKYIDTLEPLEVKNYKTEISTIRPKESNIKYLDKGNLSIEEILNIEEKYSVFKGMIRVIKINPTRILYAEEISGQYTVQIIDKIKPCSLNVFRVNKFDTIDISLLNELYEYDKYYDIKRFDKRIHSIVEKKYNSCDNFYIYIHELHEYCKYYFDDIYNKHLYIIDSENINTYKTVNIKNASMFPPTL